MQQKFWKSGHNPKQKLTNKNDLDLGGNPKSLNSSSSQFSDFVQTFDLLKAYLYIYYSPASNRGYIGFALSFRHSVIPSFRKSVTISFPLNILRTNGHNLTKFCIHINIDSIYVGIVKRQISQICNRVSMLGL